MLRAEHDLDDKDTVRKTLGTLDQAVFINLMSAKHYFKSYLESKEYVLSITQTKDLVTV